MKKTKCHEKATDHQLIRKTVAKNIRERNACFDKKLSQKIGIKHFIESLNICRDALSINLSHCSAFNCVY